ncbi:FAD/NAD(P)-binding protein [Rhizobium sp. SSA_523]|uniref:FAD/NAD(P)-binding protein n=1 Tax=Rhizobium sp. SSA_523 TaxID=2952477 RepID=UPI0020908595|nr:FAD/NAD(P)-binding protein [Rhizobium sp. SSA_523]MCO5732142.1 FAD/NAD(P)-binding protein [Rhizobium sp. SSA_523]WKC25616.1 FAD/NAD(P)-binding protein [Rhizobium sp. SSA_523]
MTLHVAIIGGGASGTLAAAHLLQRRVSPQRLRITIVEARRDVGAGLAYSTDQACHLLNTRVHNMSAFAEDPAHFSRWLERQGFGPGLDMDFVPRKTYGAYLADLLAPAPEAGPVPRLQILHEECVGLRVHDHGVEVSLSDGTVVPSHFAILATGFSRDDRARTGLEDPWTRPALADPRAPVILVGTGLTMVDMLLSLLDAGQTAPIHAISRRGLLPQPHRPTRPLKLAAADIPIGASVAYLLRWLRATIRAHEAAGGDWRDVLDGLRPHTQLLWRHLPQDSRQRFLRHGATLWDIHRHRMPPSSAARLAEAQAAGLLHIVKGHFRQAERQASSTSVTYRPSGEQAPAVLEGAYAIDCRGFRRLSLPVPSRLLQALLDQGLARLDPLHLGLQFDANDALITDQGQSSQRIFGVGPITRATHFEIIAVPDIRVQAARLAERLLGTPGLSAIATG